MPFQDSECMYLKDITVLLHLRGLNVDEALVASLSRFLEFYTGHYQTDQCHDQEHCQGDRNNLS